MNALRVTAALLILMVLGAGAALAVDQHVWQYYNGHVYALTLNWDTWLNNEAEAVSVGGHLVTVNDQAENEWLNTTFANTYCRDHPDPPCALVQIGYCLNSATQNWEWISGELVTYTNHFNRPETGQYFPEGGTHAYLHVTPHEFALTWNGDPGHCEPGHDPGGLAKGIIERMPFSGETFQLIVAGCKPPVPAPGVYRFNIDGTGGAATQLSTIPEGEVSDAAGVDFRSSRELLIGNRQTYGDPGVSRFLLDASGVGYTYLGRITHPGMNKVHGISHSNATGELFVTGLSTGLFRFTFSGDAPVYQGLFSDGFADGDYHDVYVVPTGEKILVVGGSNKIRQYSVGTDGSLTKLPSVVVPGRSFVSLLTVRPNGELYASGTEYISRLEFDENWTPVFKETLSMPYYTVGVAFSPDGQEMFVGYHNFPGAVHRYAYQQATDSWQETGFISTPGALDLGVFLPNSEPPTVTITSPTSTVSYATDQPTVNIAGNASGNLGYITVTWSNNRGGTGTATGGANWTASEIALQPGENVITVVTRDASGLSAFDRITVYYDTGTLFQLIVAGAPSGTPAPSDWKGVYRFNIAGTGGAATAASTIPNGEVSDPIGVAFRGSRELLIGNRQGGTSGGVSRFALDSFGINYTPLGRITQSGMDRVCGPYCDPATGELFVASVFAGLFRFTFSGDTPVYHGLFFDGLTDGAYQDAYIIPTGEKMLVVGNGNKIRQYSLGPDGSLTKLPPVTVPGAADLTWFGVRPDGELYVSNIHGGDQIFRFRFDENWNLVPNGSVSVGGPIGVEFSPDGTEMFVGKDATSNAGVYRFAYQPANDSWVQTGFINTPGSGDVGIFLPNSEPPTVTITSPTSTETYATDQPAINLAGTATGNQGHTFVTWISDRGGIGRFSGSGSWSFTGIPLQPGDNELTVITRDASELSATDTIVVHYGPAQVTVGQARQRGPGAWVLIDDAVVTATNIASGSVFVESSDRTAGIKVVTAETLSVGKSVIFNGIVDRIDGEYQIRDVTFEDISDGVEVDPVGMNTRTIANDPTEFLDYYGINTTGMLIRFAGKVSGVISAQRLIYVDDGGGYEDGIGPVLGIRVHVPTGITLPTKNRNVIVTGISRVEKFTLTDWAEVNGDYYPKDTVIYVPSVWLRDTNDLQVLPL